MISISRLLATARLSPGRDALKRTRSRGAEQVPLGNNCDGSIAAAFAGLFSGEFSRDLCRPGATTSVVCARALASVTGSDGTDSDSA